MVQESVPDALRGRVMSLYALVFTGVMPFASMTVAWLADLIGMRRELVLVAVLYAICSMILIPMLRRTSHGADPDAEQLPAEKDSTTWLARLNK
jgi:predicted MFS family arabinose efflux permease